MQNCKLAIVHFTIIFAHLTYNNNCTFAPITICTDRMIFLYFYKFYRDDPLMLSKVMNYISSGDIMREESLCQSLCPIPPLLENDKYDEAFYRVGSTGAAVSLYSSVALIYYYCSKLPSDMLVKVYSLTFPRITYIKICICMCV